METRELKARLRTTLLAARRALSADERRAAADAANAAVELLEPFPAYATAQLLGGPHASGVWDALSADATLLEFPEAGK